MDDNCLGRSSILRGVFEKLMQKITWPSDVQEKFVKKNVSVNEIVYLNLLIVMSQEFNR